MKPLLLTCLLVLPPVLAFSVNRWVAGDANLPPMGPVDGDLRPCPPGFDCVGSEDPEGAIEAIPFQGDPDEARTAMIHLLRTESGAEYVDVTGDYMHLVFARPYLKLVEDVELLLDRENQVFQIRALARTARRDGGLPGRIEGIAQRWKVYEARLAAVAGEAEQTSEGSEAP